jgi:2-dehydropantoate 2-reductase
MKEMIPVLKVKGSKLDVMTKVLSNLPPRVVGLLMRKVVFSPKSVIYALVAHNHTKVGYAVQEVILEARKHGIKAPRLYDVERLITKQ